jgi:hypothetical protein
MEIKNTTTPATWGAYENTQLQAMQYYILALKSIVENLGESV